MKPLKTIIILSFMVTSLIFTSNCKKEENKNQTVTDIDGNVYQTVTIGTQVWLAENLKTTKFNDGVAISLVNGNAERDSLTTPGYCWYHNVVLTELFVKNTYGALYNWYAVNTGKLCPAGWHVPSEAEWSILTTYLGGDTIAGAKLKETGNNYWGMCYPIQGVIYDWGDPPPGNTATNASGFAARGGGIYRSRDSSFYDNGIAGYWWSASEYDAAYAWRRYVACSGVLFRGFDKKKTDGLSVRCIKD